MQLIEMFKKLKANPLPVLTVKDICRITAEKKTNTYVYLSRMKAKNLIHEIEKGKYTLLEDPVEITPFLVQPSYISFLYALYLHGITNQIPLKIQIVSPKRKKSILFKDTEIKFIKMNTKRIFGYEKTRYGNGYILLAEPEKTIVDSVFLQKHCSVSETWNALQTHDFNADKLLEYAQKMHSKALLKRVGFLLDSVGKDYYQEVRRSMSKKFEPLNPLKKSQGKKNKKWKIIINEVL